MTDIERSGSVSDKDARELVLITGASGFIAAALIARLGERYTVVGLDRAGPPDPPPPAAAVAIDLGSDEAVRAARMGEFSRAPHKVLAPTMPAARYGGTLDDLWSAYCFSHSA